MIALPSSAAAASAPPCPQVRDTAALDPATTDPSPAPRLGQALLPRRADGRVQVGFTDPWARKSSFVDTRLDMQRRIGSTLTRFDVVWGEMQPYDAAHAPGWEDTDEVYCAAVARGLRPVLVLDTVPWWATNHSSRCPQQPLSLAPTKCFMPPSPDHVADLRFFAKQVAYRYPGAAAIEAWNEPNAETYWTQPGDTAAGEPHARTYADRVLAPVYQGAKSGDADTPVLAGAMANIVAETAEHGDVPIDAFLDGLLATPGAASHMDALSLHPYSQWRTKEYDTVMGLVDGVLARHPEVPHPHLWLTEIGAKFDLPTGENQARVLKAVYARINARTDVDAVLFHTLLNTSAHQPDEGYGWVRNVVDHLFLPRRVYCDFAAMLATPVNCGLSV